MSQYMLQLWLIMINIKIVIFIMLWHFISDWLLQADWMAIGKSKRFGFNKSMISHIGVITLAWIPFGFIFGLLNALSHWIIDAISSQFTSYFWKKEQRHWFFVTIGFDQFLHMFCLFGLLEFIPSSFIQI